jgi:hypothetical protein
MEWTIDAVTKRPSLATGTCTATVWNSGRHGYAASVTHRGMATAQYGFTTIEGAQAWCLTQLAGLRVAGKCASVTQLTDD